MQILARSLPYLPTLFSKRFPFILSTASATAAVHPVAFSTAEADPISSAATDASTSSTHPSPAEGASILSENDLANLRSLLPSLCNTGHPLEAVRLLDAALLAAPPLSSLPLPDLIDCLCSLPDMSATMALLSALRSHPRHPSPLPFCAMIISAYFRLRRLREAAKVFAWLCRADSPSRPDIEIYRTAVRGFCESGRAFEAVRVTREIVRDGLVPTVELRVLLCQVLLREARVQEALDLDSAIKKVVEEDVGHINGINGIAELLDCMIKGWEE